MPESKRYGAASSFVGVIGAGSRAPLKASLKVREPLDGLPPEILFPNALYVKLNFSPSDFRSAVSCSLTASTELFDG